MLASLIVPWPRRSLKISCSLSPSSENIQSKRAVRRLFLRSRSWSRRLRRCRPSLLDPEGPVSFDFLASGFYAQNHSARFLAQFLRDLIGNRPRFRIVSRGNQTQPTDSKLDAAGIGWTDRAEVRFDER